MTEDNKTMTHSFRLEGDKMTITAVKSVPTFDAHEIDIVLYDEELHLLGDSMNIDRLDLDEGVVEISGSLRSMAYGKDTKKNILKRIFK